MTAYTYVLRATVESERGVNGLRIEAWDADARLLDLVDVAVADVRGNFEMRLDGEYVAALLPPSSQLTFRFFDASRPLGSARSTVWRLQQQVTKLRIPLSGAPGDAVGQKPASAVVRGVIRHANGTPAPGMTVRAFDRNLGASGFGDTELGHAVTAADGRYEIRYMMPAGGKLKPDLIVRVDAAATQPPRLAVGATEAPRSVAGGSGDDPLAKAAINVPGFTIGTTTDVAAESRLISNAPTVALIDLGLEGSIAPRRSEHGALLDAAKAVLTRSRLTAADLKPEHVEYVARAAGVQTGRVRMLAQAGTLARDAAGTVDAEVFYGLLRNGFRGNVDALIDEPIATTRMRLQRAADRNQVSARGDQLDHIASQLRELAVARAIPTSGTTIFSAALGSSLASADVHRAFMRRWIGRTGTASDFWDDVRADAQLAPHADDLELTVRLQILFGGHQPALDELKARRQAGSVTSLRDLARWQDDEWDALVAKTGVPVWSKRETEAAGRAAFSAALAAVVRRAFPTEYLRGRATRPVAPLGTRYVSQLAAANPTLDLRRPLPETVEWGSIAQAERDAARTEWEVFRSEASTFRRVPARSLLETAASANGSNPIRAAANQVLLSAKTLDLEVTSVDQYLAANPGALSAVAENQRPAVIGYLQSVQRVVRLVAKPEAVDRLLGDGLDSAMRIARTPRAQFVARYGTVLGGSDAAADAYSKAFRTATTSQLALTTVSQSLVDISPWAVRGGASDKPQVPDFEKLFQLFKDKAGGGASWPVLFGNNAWCDCAECNSAYGPAAYFVDLLHMIDVEGDAHAPANRLFARRPDLQYLPLSCDNTNIAIPYIDLVNEILEIYIATQRNIVAPKSYDNQGLTAQELRAVPQNVISEVYDLLASEVYPFTLPFHRALAVMRTYLDQLGTSYRDVFEAFGPRGGSELMSHLEHLAAEDLGLSPHQFKVIALVPGPNEPQLPQYYGYGVQDATWRQTLSSVPELLRRTGISYDDLYALSTTFFVNPGNALVLEAPIDCQIDYTHLANADDDAWSRLHRFVRLWRSSDWTIADLDRVIFAIAKQAVLGHDELRAVGLAKRVAERLDQPIVSVAALWGNIDGWGSDSLYQRLFLNKTVARITDDVDAFVLDAATYDPEHPERKPVDGVVRLAITTNKLEEHLSRVLAALRISSSEFDAIWAHAFPGQASVPLRVDTLSTLYRYRVLAKGVGMRIEDLVTLLTLTGATPFASPAATLDFCDLVELVTGSGFSVAQLDYIYRHVVPPGQGPAPSDSVVYDALDKVRAALAAVRQDIALTDDPDGTLLAARLSQLQPPDIVARIMTALDPAGGLTLAVRQLILATYLGATLAGAEQQVLPPQSTPEPDPNLPLETDDTTNPNYPTYAAALAARRASNRATILDLVSSWLRQSLGESAVISTVAATLGVTDAIARRLLVDWIPGDGQMTALATLLAVGGGGLTGHFFTAAGFTGAETVHDGGLATAQLTTQSAYRSARWGGRILPLADGEHVFVVRTDGAGTLTVDGTPLAFNGGPTVTDHELTVTLTAHHLATITVEYDAGAAGGRFDLLWRLASTTTAQPVSADALFGESGLAALDDGAGPGFAWRRAHKAALLIAGFGLSEDEVDFVQLAEQPFGAVALRDLPMVAPNAATLGAHLECWRRLAVFAALRSSLPASDIALVDVLAMTDGANDPAVWADRLCSATGWDVGTVRSLFDVAAMQPADWSGSGGQVLSRLIRAVAGDPPTTAYDPGGRLAKLQICIDLVKRIGVSAATLQAWTDETPTKTDGDQVIQAVRARYSDDAEWFQIAQTQNDKLRQQQRDALVAYLLPRPLPGGVVAVDESSLFEQFLIDVEMCACGLTSRVKQAISSVQTFIQRILLGLEPGIAPDTIDPDKWKWNSIYRIWQANREIFLYPENWIDPELRLDKTPFFADLQSQLSQGPLDAANVEDAFRGYLEKLVEVSRLKICALHWQREGKDPSSPIAPDDEIDTLHVVARTPGAHATYYYRTLLGAASGNGGTEWTPWQKIDVDIQTDGDSGDVQMVLTTFNRRLYMFWAELTEKPEDKQPGAKQGEPPPDPLTHWEIRLAWSAYRNGAWSPKQVSSDSITSKRFIDKDDLTSYQHEYEEFKASADAAEAKLTVGKFLLAAIEQAFWSQIQQVIASFTSVTNTLALVGMTLNGEFIDPFGGSLADFEDYCANTSRSVTDYLEDFFNVSELFGISLSPDLSSLEATWGGVLQIRADVADAQKGYDKLAKTVTDFESGKTDLAIPEETRRKDHTIWLGSASDEVKIHVLRHDETSTPRILGYFTLSDDGRSVSATGAGGRTDLTHLIPSNSTASLNGFKLDQGASDGLDFPSLPDLLKHAGGVTVYHEHWYSHPVTANTPRPFFVATDGEVHAGLPNARELTIPEWPTAFKPMDLSALPVRAIGVVQPTQHQTLSYRSGNAVVDIVNDKTSFGLITRPANVAKLVVQPKPIVFEAFHHPFARDLIRRLERDGVPGVLTIEAQTPKGTDHGAKGGHFDDELAPSTKFVATPYSGYDVDFRPQGPYAQYNWELFFHAPYLIASRLMQDARYEEARDWLHYIFNPTTSSPAPSPDRFWNVQWFRDHGASLGADQLMTVLATNQPSTLVAQIHAQIAQWQQYPADPHRIAWLRTSAYQKAIFFKYLDNLIAWADSLFTQNTIETINQATQLYIFASHLLGPRPQHVPQEPEVSATSYADLRGGLDAMSDMLALVESAIHPLALVHHQLAASEANALLGISHLPVMFPQPAQDPTVTAKPLVFCVPPNSKLLGYYDTIDDRLFKIRNCMNIEGVVQQLPLFDPPIDPAMLVKAAAMGLDIGSILGDLSAPLPFHRFAAMAQKANDACNEVKSLGSQLLAALEKKDAEGLAMLRATHETAVLTAVRDVKKQQLADATTMKESLQKSREATQAKYDFYASRTFMNAFETQQIAQMKQAQQLAIVAGMVNEGASEASLLPQFEMGPTGMGVHGTTTFGGVQISTMIKMMAEALSVSASALSASAQMAGILGGHDRRQDEWNFQKELAKRELEQIDKQLAAADIKIAIASLEVSNQQLQIDNAKKVEDTLRTKYTNAELYQWMVTQLSTTYYQAYKLAYDLAKRAERCYRYELGIPSSSFIQFGYWDSMRKGLLGGEQLALDLKRLEAAYLQADRRDYEIARQVSLVLHDPAAFVKLRETGSCEVTLPEELFDADYPGHYFRRLRSVSLTLPCVAGPYTPINCTLTLLSSAVRTSSSVSKHYPEQGAPNDPRFSHEYGAIQSVATSHGQNDAGMFEVNFRDERYLPFEGAGAVSKWRIDLPKDTNAFDFDTLSDVILRVQYTARDGGAALAASARTWLAERRKTAEADLDPNVTTGAPLRRLFRVRFEFSDAWIAFRTALAKGNASLTLVIDRERFPYQFRAADLTITGVQVFATASSALAAIPVQLVAPGGDSVGITLSSTMADPTFLAPDKGWPATTGEVDVASGAAATWRIDAPAGAALASARDVLLVVTYTAKTGN